jgi:DNA anti-recombination protein RmuC
MKRLDDAETNRTNAEEKLMKRLDDAETDRSNAEERLMLKLEESKKAQVKDRQLINFMWKVWTNNLKSLETRVDNHTKQLEKQLEKQLKKQLVSTGKLDDQMKNQRKSVEQLGFDKTHLLEQLDERLQRLLGLQGQHLIKQMRNMTGQLESRLSKTVEDSFQKGIPFQNIKYC